MLWHNSVHFVNVSMYERSQRQSTALLCLHYITLSCGKVFCKYLNPVWQHRFHLTSRWLPALSASHLYLMESLIHVNLGYVETSRFFKHWKKRCMKTRNNSKTFDQMKQKGQLEMKSSKAIFRVRFNHSFISTFIHSRTTHSADSSKDGAWWMGEILQKNRLGLIHLWAFCPRNGFVVL